MSKKKPKPKKFSIFTHTASGKELYCSAADFNAEYIIRYYPHSDAKLGKHKLIGFTTMVEIIGDRTINQVLERVMNDKRDMPEVKLRGGDKRGPVMFRFFRR